MAPSDLPLNGTVSLVDGIDLLFCHPTLILASTRHPRDHPSPLSIPVFSVELTLSLESWVLELLDEALPDRGSPLRLSGSMSGSLETSP